MTSEGITAVSERTTDCLLLVQAVMFRTKQQALLITSSRFSSLNNINIYQDVTDPIHKFCMHQSGAFIERYSMSTVALILFIRYINSLENMALVYKMAPRT